MKKKIYKKIAISFLPMLFLFPNTLTGQTTTENYVKTTIYKKKTIDGNYDAISGATLTNDNKSVSINYFDGLGRPKQSLVLGAGGNKEDIITHFKYDVFGRQIREFLPYANSSYNPWIRTGNVENTIQNFYQNKYAEDFLNVASNAVNAYSKKIVEKSPLNRILEQSAPGKDWGIGSTFSSKGYSNNSNTIKFEYDTNTGPSFSTILEHRFDNPNDYQQWSAVGNTYISTGMLVILNGNTSGGCKIPLQLNAGKTVKISYDLSSIEPDTSSQTVFSNITLQYIVNGSSQSITLSSTPENGTKEHTLYIPSNASNFQFLIYIPFTSVPSDVFYVNYFHVKEVTDSTTPSNDIINYIANIQWDNNNKLYNPSLVYNGTYFEGNLRKIITKDENWKSGQTYPKDHTTEEYTNKQGQVVLKRAFNEGIPHDTHYVYDLRGNLTYVIPPKAEGTLSVPTTTVLDELCYQYKYDHRNRLVEKKIPGKGWEYIIYDKLDRPIITSDSNLSSNGKWLFTKYDALGRVAYTGVRNGNTNRSSLQNSANNTTPQFETKVSSSPSTLWTTNSGSVLFYNNNTFPTYTSGSEIYTINYYDTYLDLPSGFTAPTTVYGQAVTTNAKGLATVSKVRVLETTSWITTVTYYDAKARPIYLYSTNPYLGTTDVVESKLDDFTGKVLETKTTHTKGTNSPIVTIDRFEYDHQDRLISQTQQINDHISERIVKNNYDDIGQLASKLVGNGTKSGYKDITSGISISNNTITKTGSNGWNEGLATQGTIQGDGYVEFLTPNTSQKLMVGLSSDNTNASYSSIDYAIYLVNSTNNLLVYESGTNKGSFGNYELGDVFKVERIGNKIYYKRNEEIFYTSTSESTGALLGDISIHDSGNKIKDFKIVDNSNGLQKVDYDYNVRGWLKQINDVDNLGSDLFSFKINYNEDIQGSGGGSSLYNGNISQTIWATSNDITEKRSYSYQYDALNRLKAAYSRKGEGLLLNDRFSMWTNYDKNGNLTRLNRSGHITSSPDVNNNNHYGTLDDLVYTYDNGNKLKKVLDNGNDVYGFKDGSNITTEYTYDANGNMKTDANKGITNINYNHLNLPTQVTVNGKNIEYVYDASGLKLEKKVYEFATPTSTKYAGNFIYEKGAAQGSLEKLQFFNHAEGYVTYNDGRLQPNENPYNYVYQYKDHLGNVRVSFTDKDKNYENILDCDFKDSFDGWKQNGSVNYSLVNGRLKANVNSSWEGIRHEMQDVEVTQGETYTVKIKFDKANTQSAVRFYIVEYNASGSHLRYVGLNYNIQTGEHTFTYTVGSNAKKIYLRLDKDNQNTSTETQFYVDYITFTKGSLEIVEESNYYPFGLKHKGYNNVTSSNGNSTAQKWKYNGVEYEESLGLNLYEMDVRMYDPAIGRFNGIDPVTHYSQGTSVAFDNNPIYWADPSGADSMDGSWFREGERLTPFANNDDCCGDVDGGTLPGFSITLKGGGASETRLYSTEVERYSYNGTFAQYKKQYGVEGSYSEVMAWWKKNHEAEFDTWTADMDQKQQDDINREKLMFFTAPFVAIEDVSKVLPANATFSMFKALPIKPFNPKSITSKTINIEDVMTNPNLLDGKSLNSIKVRLGDTRNWVRGVMNKSTTHPNGGFMIRELNKSGSDFTGRLIQYHPGTSRHFNWTPYWKVSSGTAPTVRIPLK